MNVYKCGEKATPKCHQVTCMITCVTIRFDKVTYELSYFQHGEQKTVWMHEEEFDITVEKELNVGFKS